MQFRHYIYRQLTTHEQSRLHRFKRLACFLAIALGLCGCATPVKVSPGWSIMNNTGYILVAYQDGEMMAKMPPGTAIVLKRNLFSLKEFSSVNLAAYSEDGSYQGANSYLFSKFAPYNWQINNVHRQEFTQ
jgi:hypothetical protein